MKLKERHHTRVKDALTVAYREKERNEVGGTLWQANTMSHIRRLGLLDAKTGYLMNLEQLVWRLAPAACALILIFSVCLLNIDFAREYEMVKLFIEDPVQYAFLQTLGI